MAKKTQSATLTGKTTTITLTLPDDAKLLRTGTLVATRGNLGSMSQFQYRTVADIAQAIFDILQQVEAVEIAPPTIPPCPEEIKAKLEAQAGDHVEPDGTCPYMVENIYRHLMHPGESWLDFLIRRKSEPEGDPLQDLGQPEPIPVFEAPASAQASLF